MRNMIRGGEVTKEESDMWLTSLAFIPKPDVMMLKEVKVIILSHLIVFAFIRFVITHMSCFKRNYLHFSPY